MSHVSRTTHSFYGQDVGLRQRGVLRGIASTEHVLAFVDIYIVPRSPPSERRQGETPPGLQRGRPGRRRLHPGPPGIRQTVGATITFAGPPSPTVRLAVSGSSGWPGRRRRPGRSPGLDSATVAQHRARLARIPQRADRSRRSRCGVVTSRSAGGAISSSCARATVVRRFWTEYEGTRERGVGPAACRRPTHHRSAPLELREAQHGRSVGTVVDVRRLPRPLEEVCDVMPTATGYAACPTLRTR